MKQRYYITMYDVSKSIEMEAVDHRLQEDLFTYTWDILVYESPRLHLEEELRSGNYDFA